jgi:hypothetical protein
MTKILWGNKAKFMPQVKASLDRAARRCTDGANSRVVRSRRSSEFPILRNAAPIDYLKILLPQNATVTIEADTIIFSASAFHFFRFLSACNIIGVHPFEELMQNMREHATDEEIQFRLNLSNIDEKNLERVTRICRSRYKLMERLIERINERERENYFSVELMRTGWRVIIIADEKFSRIDEIKKDIYKYDLDDFEIQKSGNNLHHSISLFCINTSRIQAYLARTNEEDPNFILR